MINKQVFKGASVLSLSQIVVAICTFARNILVARMVSVEDFGIATTFAVTLAMIEMTSNLAFEKILVQDEQGGGDDMLASAHFLHFAKSVLTGIILLLIGPLMASLFKVESLVWAFQLLALIPVIRGLTHFDVVTYQRSMRFAPTALIDAIPQVLTVFFAYPLGVWLGDYRVMLGLVLLQPVAYTILSHVYAVRPYRWQINKDLIYKKIHFGWPLLINGFLMFAIFNGDKAIVGNIYSMEVLGWYSAVFALTLMPTLLFAKVCTTLLLPALSVSFRENKKAFEDSCSQATVLCIGVASFTFLFFIIAGSAVIYLCYGDRYLEGARVVSLLALMQAIRIVRIAPTIIAISYSDTKNAMYSNFFRVSILPIAIVLAMLQYSIEWLVVVSVVGEFLALFWSVYLLKLNSNKVKYVKSLIAYFVLFIVFGVATQIIVWLLGVKFSTLLDLVIIISIGVLVSFVAFIFHLLLENKFRVLLLGLLHREPT